MTEEPSGARPPIGRGARASKGRKVELSSLTGQDTEPARLTSGISELDRVLGGGLVAGSATLLGGDPGIGKSTLLLQAAASMARKDLRTVYISGEEALAQLRMRAARLKLTQAPVELAAETNIADIRKTLESAGDVSLVIMRKSEEDRTSITAGPDHGSMPNSTSSSSDERIRRPWGAIVPMCNDCDSEPSRLPAPS